MFELNVWKENVPNISVVQCRCHKTKPRNFANIMKIYCKYFVDNVAMTVRKIQKKYKNLFAIFLIPYILVSVRKRL